MGQSEILTVTISPFCNIIVSALKRLIWMNFSIATVNFMFGSSFYIPGVRLKLYSTSACTFVLVIFFVSNILQHPIGVFVYFFFIFCRKSRKSLTCTQRASWLESWSTVLWPWWTSWCRSSWSSWEITPTPNVKTPCSKLLPARYKLQQRNVSNKRLFYFEVSDKIQKFDFMESGWSRMWIINTVVVYFYFFWSHPEDLNSKPTNHFVNVALKFLDLVTDQCIFLSLPHLWSFFAFKTRYFFGKLVQHDLRAVSNRQHMPL